MDVNQNTLRLVAALVKITSAVTDIDELSEDKRFKFQLKKDLNSWQNWLEEYTHDSLNKLSKADDKTLMILINLYDDFNNRMIIDDKFIGTLNILLAKINSSLRDLDQIEPPYPDYIGNLRNKLLQMVNSHTLRQFSQVGLHDIINEMNRLSDEMIVETH